MEVSDNIVIRNIYVMMAYAFRALDASDFSKISMENFANIHDLMAAILSVGISVQRKRGFEREYKNHEEDYLGVRGHIDPRRTARLRMANKRKIGCVFDEYSEDTYKNRILRYCAELLASSSDVSESRRLDLKRSLLSMQEMSPINPSRIEWGRLSYHRNNGSYQILMNVCYMVINGMLPATGKGDVRFREFSSDRELPALYEKFLLEYFKRHHPDLNPSARKLVEAGMAERPSFLPSLNTDIVLEHDKRLLIIDAKCYGQILKTHYQHEALSPSNVNQIHMYVSTAAYNTDLEVSGMLLYAKTKNECIEPQTWTTTGFRYFFEVLDLDRPFAEISFDLDTIADSFRNGLI